MNFTGGNRLPNIGRRINWQLVVLAGGLAVAITAGAVAFERGSSPATTAVTRPEVPAAPAPAISTSGRGAELTYLVVGSQAEADTLRSTLSTEAAHWPELANQLGRWSIVALETPADAAEFMEMIALNTGLRVIDLRTSATVSRPVVSQAVGDQAVPIVYLVASEAEKVMLELQFHESGAMGETTPRSVFVLEGPDAGQLYNTIVGDQMEHGAFHIVDLR